MAEAPRVAVAAGAAPALLRWTGRALVATIWISAAIFGFYIMVFYAGALVAGTPEQWNGVLPRLYEERTPLTTIGIGAHFAAGGILLLLGPVQLIRAVRDRMPRLHRWIGRFYAGAAFLAAAGGLGFILSKGTVGGVPMDLGFGLYGALTLVAAVETVRHARARRLERHRAWAIRLFALAIGSWLYRMDYGFWFMITGGIGHTPSFDGPFDIVMAFFFYLPNLAVAEAFIRARRAPGHPAFQLSASALLAAAMAFILLATYYFTAFNWGPEIAARLSA